ncbi:hypothetical protein [Achromobacter xylosoxidans]|uniref:hypothetical protein n=1 Tax=Alcaligenes xylosoxydans xylosoxydans TaxID=85698 RepID=UPI001EEDC28D|nr:hypothetical protein [Achromobacter xylosoxidans]
MAELRIRPAALDDAVNLVEDLRPQDAAEILAVHGERADLAQAIRTAITRSSHAWSAFYGAQIAMIGGVAPIGSLLGGNIGSPWLLGSRLMFRRPGALTRTGRRYVAFMHTLYPDLENFIDVRNRVSIAWLQRLGFTIHFERPVLMGPDRVPFYPFTKSV